MNILHATTVHRRYDVRIFQKECTTLAGYFSEVSLLVCDGRGNETKNGVHIIDTGHSSGVRILRILLQPIKMLRKIRDLSPDVVHIHDPEMMVVGFILRRLGFIVIYDVHEDVPRQLLNKPWLPRVLRKPVSVIFEFFENFVSRRLSGIIAATPHILDRFQRLNNRTIDINNFPLLDELSPVKEGRRRQHQICYVGGITRIRGLRPIIEALPLMPEVTFVLCGNFSEPEFEAELRSMDGWRQVDFRGFANRDVVREVLAESFAGMVTLLPTPNYLDSLPVKMFEYMSAELPVIASDFPLWRRIIDGAAAGICVDPQSPQAIATAAQRLAADQAMVTQMGRLGRKAVLDRYNWPAEAQKLLKFYSEIS